MAVVIPTVDGRRRKAASKLVHRVVSSRVHMWTRADTMYDVLADMYLKGIVTDQNHN